MDKIIHIFIQNHFFDAIDSEQQSSLVIIYFNEIKDKINVTITVNNMA